MTKAWIAAVALACTLCACTVVDRVRTAAPQAQQKWAVLPMANHTETPQAGRRAEAIVESVLRTLGVTQLERYPAELAGDGLLEPGERKLADQALAWAKSHGVRYAVSGSVEEWRYKVGVDGEPAVGLVVYVTDLQGGGSVIYSASGAKSGWNREALAGVAQKLVKELLAELGPAR